MADDISFQHGKHFVQVKATLPKPRWDGEEAHMQPAQSPGIQLTVYLDGQPLGNLPHRELEEPIDTEERARRLVHRKLGRRL